MRMKPESIPPLTGDLYEAAEMVLDDADNFYRNWIETGRQQLRLYDKHVVSFRAGIDAIARKSIDLAAHNGSEALHFARKLMRAKDANEVFTLQLEFYQKQFGAFAAQLQDLGRTAIKAAELAS